jgi:uncharacterized damage-inducible protein DinB
MMREILLDLFAYDYWANREWLQKAENFKNTKRATQILQHIIGCQLGWITVITDMVDRPDSEIQIPEDMAPVYQAWVKLISERDPMETVSFSGASGAERHIKLYEMAHHVLNHGTYHRGQLRGLAEAEGLIDFPETDSMIWFTRTRQTTAE